MRPDVLSLHRFYETRLGAQAAQIIAARIKGLLPVQAGAITVGIGYTLPYLDALSASEDENSAARFLAFMPERQGVCHWPSLAGSQTALVDQYNLPLADSSVDRVLLVHGLEHAHKPTHMLREVWRVLVPGGQVVIVVPNRMRTWSAAEATPFGHGKPYSKSQLFRLMTEQMLPPEAWQTALMMPPTNILGASSIMRVAEHFIGMMGKNLGGALIVTARKQVYGGLPRKAVKMKAQPVFTHLRERA